MFQLHISFDSSLEDYDPELTFGAQPPLLSRASSLAPLHPGL